MGEIIHLGIGQAGSNLVASLYERLTQDLSEEKGILSPRAVLIDSDADLRRDLKGMYPDFHAAIDADGIVTGRESAADFSFRGYYDIGRGIMD